jgi:3-keto-L-gulonate-6-phosphate decarboxylase
VLRAIAEQPDVVILHRGIDEEKTGKTRWELIREIKQMFKDKKLLVAVAGGIEPANVEEALKAGSDILVVGRYVTQSKDVQRAARDFLDHMGPDMDLFRVHVE